MNGFSKGDQVEWNSPGGKAVKKQTAPTRIKGHTVATSAKNPEFIVEAGGGKRAAHKLDALTKEQNVAETFKPTKKMAENAERGLRLRKKFGRGGTEVGVARANQLAAREHLTPADIKSMYSYFARHAVDKNTTTHRWGSEKDPSAGFIAWLLWGGEEGKVRIDRQRKKLG